MAFDFKREYKEFYAPSSKPHIVNVPPAKYLAVQGKGDPNEPDGAYQQAISVLYAVAYTLKMSYKTDHRIDGFFDYVVPPLEGFWWQEGIGGVDYGDKRSFQWLSVLRVPDFITADDVDWAKTVATRKKRIDCSELQLIMIAEGLCVQILHVGPYDNEPASVALMDAYIASEGYENDLNDERRHHEIYLSDARKTEPQKMRTVIRHPIRRRG
ncbi:MAG: GyrI-like domain-containing protein [Coriobacteriales bacterium]|nr:GyrI-like domain-containing protein [Coriobacteriales bacterium]MBQ6586893.1 GyrI-like domain-containing protein [Coriobacteriales bacterium]